ncbi:hypothetical protein GNX71_12990 [Variovorax sp. RKNM96]|uniref:ABC-three component system protein n=1 Tax=Variovorax sp. RKNM96 TaxID=2681552 RepID=UPI00197F0066|nr:ABC-three component system protein [Variovorax sp. RKNM96]QSI30450.1 hypothetical protein GNX71_12990 [Variovorax sp. RKNM96]
MSSAAYIDDGSHSAVSSALGFYYQSLYGLLSIVRASQDDAAVCLERLDDVEILTNGQSLLSQLKHSLSNKPAAVTLSSAALWKTLKAWIDVLPAVSLNNTRFQLVTVAPIPSGSPLEVLLDATSPRATLLALLHDEAQRVVDEHQAGRAAGKHPVPHADRVASCAAYLELDHIFREKFLSRITVQPAASNIIQIPTEIAKELKSFPPERREAITGKLMEWWDLQVVYSFCDKRDRAISMLEVQQKVAEIAGELERDELLADFQFVTPPGDHIPSSMIARQLQLVGGTDGEVQAAEREEWRARSQRHKWLNERVDMAVRIHRYDQLLAEAWRDKHCVMVETHANATEDAKRVSGLEIFRWSYSHAHAQIPPFAHNWSTTYYVRGSYQVLAVEQEVGWHPDYKALLAKKP